MINPWTALVNNGDSANEIFDRIYCAAAAAARLEGESVAAASETRHSHLPGSCSVYALIFTTRNSDIADTL